MPPYVQEQRYCHCTGVFFQPTELYKSALNKIKLQLASNAGGDFIQQLRQNSAICEQYLLYSVAQSNLDYSLMYEKYGIIVPSRKSCLSKSYVIAQCSYHPIISDVIIMQN